MTEAAETIWTGEGGLAIRLAKDPSPTVLDLLGRTVWGGGRLRYRIFDVAGKLERMSDPHILTLERDGELASVFVFNRRVTRLFGAPCDSFHFAMLATEPRFAGRSYASMLADRAAAFCRERLPERGVAYAYIEDSTESSIRISDSFAPPLAAVLPLTVFSRFRAADDPRAGRLAEGERDGVVARLRGLYDGHAFDDFETSLIAEEFHVLRDGGEIVAGVQAEMLRWSVVDLPGATGWLALNLPRHLPPFRRLLNPADLRFLRFGNILAEPGREADLLRLFEAVLARCGAPLGLFLLDARSPVYRRIRAEGRLGVLDRAVGGGASKMVGDAKGFGAAEIAALREQPVLMSPLDVF